MKDMNFKYTKVNKEQLIDELFESPFLSNFFIDNDLDSNIVEQNLLTFMNFNIEKTRCINCEGINMCSQDNKGLEPVIKYLDGKVFSGYKECMFQRNIMMELERDKHIDALHLPQSIFQASFDDFDFDRGKNKTLVQSKMKRFITFYINGEKPKGMYLHGKNGAGKTYCLSALAKELKNKGINVIIAYYPDIVREFKSRVSTHTVEELVSKLKQVEVLMLDDIGGEGNSVWVRDEILGPILQFRLLDNRPTFFSSNYDLKKLMSEHFAQFTREQDNVRAARIGVRIRELTLDNVIEI